MLTDRSRTGDGTSSERATLRAVLVDDEPLARERLRAMLEEEPGVRVVGEAGSGASAIRLMRERQPDLVFLDIQMPAGDGFEVVRSMGSEAPVVIFVTAYDEYALRAFEVAAVDYLLKPVTAARLRGAIRRATERVYRRLPTAPADRLVRLMEQLAREHVRVPVHDDGRVIFLDSSEIDWIEASDDHVRLHVGKTVHVTRETMARMAARLPGGFVRIHRSAIVNTARIREVQPWVKGDYVVILEDGTRLTTGRVYRDEVRALLR